jgi:hypothetical protein
MQLRSRKSAGVRAFRKEGSQPHLPMLPSPAGESRDRSRGMHVLITKPQCTYVPMWSRLRSTNPAWARSGCTLDRPEGAVPLAPTNVVGDVDHAARSVDEVGLKAREDRDLLSGASLDRHHVADFVGPNPLVPGMKIPRGKTLNNRVYMKI